MGNNGNRNRAVSISIDPEASCICIGSPATFRSDDGGQGQQTRGWRPLSRLGGGKLASRSTLQAKCSLVCMAVRVEAVKKIEAELLDQLKVPVDRLKNGVDDDGLPAHLVVEEVGVAAQRMIGAERRAVLNQM